jgi:hypothetical protein
VQSSSQRPDVVRVGDVDDQRPDARPSHCIGVPVAEDTREDVKPPPRQCASASAPMPVDAPVITAISGISVDAVIPMKLPGSADLRLAVSCPGVCRYLYGVAGSARLKN